MDKIVKKEIIDMFNSTNDNVILDVMTSVLDPALNGPKSTVNFYGNADLIKKVNINDPDTIESLNESINQIKLHSEYILEAKSRLMNNVIGIDNYVSATDITISRPYDIFRLASTTLYRVVEKLVETRLDDNSEIIPDQATLTLLTRGFEVAYDGLYKVKDPKSAKSICKSIMGDSYSEEIEYTIGHIVEFILKEYTNKGNITLDAFTREDLIGKENITEMETLEFNITISLPEVISSCFALLSSLIEFDYENETYVRVFINRELFIDEDVKDIYDIYRESVLEVTDNNVRNMEKFMTVQLYMLSTISGKAQLTVGPILNKLISAGDVMLAHKQYACTCLNDKGSYGFLQKIALALSCNFNNNRKKEISQNEK